MRYHQFQILAALGLLLATLGTTAQAQVNLPFGPEEYSHDFQLFAPTEIDLDNQPNFDDYGYYLSYSKLFWSYSGEHVTIGDPDVVVLAEQIYFDNGEDPGAPPPPYQVQNGIQNTFPKAGFAMGDRYEIGYRDAGNGWVIGILDGPALQQSKVYGLGNTPYTPPPDPDYHSPPTPVSDGEFYAFGFANVHVNFATPAGYLLGFRDYLNDLTGAYIGTQGGPVLYVGNYGGLEEVERDDDPTIPFFRKADDIDENGIPGAVVIFVPGPDGILRPTTLTDFGDLHEFNIAFDTLEVRSRTKMDGVEAMWTHELTNRHLQAKHQNNYFELGAGARYLRVNDFFYFNGLGGIMGQAYSYNWLDNQIVGPQVRAKWINQRARWRVTGTTSFLFGYNIQDWSQENGIGTEFIPGALNRPLYAQPTYSQHALSFDEFSPVGELRLEAAYFVSQSIALKAGYTGTYVGNIRRAATSVRYYLPDMGFRDSGTQDLISNGFDLGIDFVY